MQSVPNTAGKRLSVGFSVQKKRCKYKTFSQQALAINELTASVIFDVPSQFYNVNIMASYQNQSQTIIHYSWASYSNCWHLIVDTISCFLSEFNKIIYNINVFGLSLVTFDFYPSFSLHGL